MIESLPTLSAGAHKPGDGKACVMEYVALLAGEPWTDSPSCTHPVLARAAQVVNDRLRDSDRHLLVPLIGRLFGTAEFGSDLERHVLSVRLACWSARQALPLARDVDRSACEGAIEAAERWASNPSDAAAHAAARAAAYAAEAAAHAAYAGRVGFLTGLIDEYDRLTGRTQHTEVTAEQLLELAALVTNGAAS